MSRGEWVVPDSLHTPLSPTPVDRKKKEFKKVIYTIQNKKTNKQTKKNTHTHIYIHVKGTESC